MKIHSLFAGLFFLYAAGWAISDHSIEYYLYIQQSLPGINIASEPVFYDRDHASLWADDSSFYVGDFGYPLCCGCLPYFQEVRVPIPSEWNVPYLAPTHLVKFSYTDNYYRLLTVLPDNRFLVYDYFVSFDSLSLLYESSILGPGGPSGKYARGSIMEKDEDTLAVLLFLGTNGMFRRVSIGDAAPSEADSLDIDTEAELTALGGGYVGTSDGQIYSYTAGNPPLFEAQPTQLSINYINAGGAAGDSGLYLDHAGGAWEPYNFGDSNYIYYKKYAANSGTELSFIDSLHNPYTYTFINTPTYISNITPSEVNPFINQGVFEYAGNDSLTVLFELQDDETNISPLIFYLKTAVPDSLMELGAIVYPSVSDRNTCSTATPSNTNNWNGNTNTFAPKLTLKNDSVFFEAEHQFCFDVPNNCVVGHFVGNFSNIAQSWELNDTLLAIVDNDTVRIVNVVSTRISLSEKDAKDFFINIQGNKLVFPFSNGTVKIFNTTGRLLKTVPIMDNLVDLSKLKEGIYFIDVNGKRLKFSLINGY
jgi:hypothetical protein